MKPLDGEQAAAVIGLSTRRLKQLCRDGAGPQQQPDGRFAPDVFGLWVFARHKADLGVSTDGEAYDFQAERGRLTKAQADKTELEVAELHGEMIRVTDAIDSWAERVSAARARLLALPSKLAPRVAAPARVAEAQELAREIIDEALNELAGDGLPARTRSRIERVQRVAPTAEAKRKPVGGPVSSAQSGGKRRAGKLVDQQG